MPRGRIVAIALLCLSFSPAIVLAQFQPPSDFLYLTAQQATTWTSGATNIVQLEGGITIQTDRATLKADRAVVWLTPLPETVLDQQRAEIALIGNANIEQGQIARSGDVLFVQTQIRGTVRLTAQQRRAQDLSESDLYRDATAIRPLQNLVPGQEPPQGAWITQRPWLTLPPLPPPTTAPTTRPVRPTQRISVSAGHGDTIQTPEGTIAAMLWGGVSVVVLQPNGDVLQLQAEEMMLFTPLTSLQELTAVERLQKAEEVVEAIYLDGDVRIIATPRDPARGEQRLRAQRVYYDLTTDRAVLTEAVVHMVDPKLQLPMVARAHLVRQLSMGEYKAQGVELSTSSFATPSYGIYSDRAYVRSYDTGDPRLGQRTVFSGTHNWFELYGVPVFYWPWAAGSVTDHGSALRELQLGSSRGFGPGIRSKWGVFETLGQPPPADLDAAYRLDYFGDRGPAAGLDLDYKGGFITETSKQPWNFDGNLTSYVVPDDQGLDRLGRQRRLVQPDETTRYRVLWEHQHFFPGDWQLQLRASAVSDPTFLEEWFKHEFQNDLPHDESINLKRQRQTEAITFSANIQPNDFVTTADMYQEQFEVEHIPEIGYYRIGDSFMDDQLTFFSANTATALHFQQSHATLADLGFRPGQTPGLPSVGTTGVTDDTIYRGDFRQEIDYPFNAGQFKIAPYVMGRLTSYDDSPDGSDQHRLFAGTGMRISTAFWRVDNTANSDLFDIHRVRHVIEPEVNLFTSAQTTDRTEVFNYDEAVDQINDVTAAQLAIHQRWQTKRGGAGQFRSVDFFTLNTEANFFLNQPDDDVLRPTVFRGLYFPSLPETSVPRNSINADALWRVSDSTAVLSDVQYNLDQQALATTSIGLAAQRDARMSYFIGARYIGEINSTIATFAANYELTPKYSLRLIESVDLSERRNQSSSVTLTRKFDRFYVTFTFFYDAVNDEGGFRFGIYPEGLGAGLTSEQVQSVIGPTP